MSNPAAVLLCPGRGSYGQGELGYLRRTLRQGQGEVAAALAQADAARRAAGEPTISELDATPAFRPALHLDGRNAAELIYFATMAHVEALRERWAIGAVAGNSMGWYTALAAAGALSVDAGWRLVRTMARLQEQVRGGQVLTTTVDDDWRTDPAAALAIDEALLAVGARGDDFLVARSIRLGGHEVLAGTEAGVKALLAALPKRRLGNREFPFRLAGHGPFHTPLCSGVAAAAASDLANLPIGAPRAFLIDGEGNAHSPWSSDPAALLRYTTTTQVVATFDFTACVRTALREFCPDALLCAGPGDSLRAPVGHVVIAEAYRGLRDRAALFDAELVHAA